jgi:hypothetical protein
MPLRVGYIHAKTLFCSQGNITDTNHAEKAGVLNVLLIEDPFIPVLYLCR